MPRDHTVQVDQAAVEVFRDFLIDRCGIPAHHAWYGACELLDRLHDAGWRPMNDNLDAMHVWAWLLEHGLHVRHEDVLDPDLRVTVDLEAS